MNRIYGKSEQSYPVCVKARWPFDYQVPEKDLRFHPFGKVLERLEQIIDSNRGRSER